MTKQEQIIKQLLDRIHALEAEGKDSSAKRQKLAALTGEQPIAPRRGRRKANG